MADKKDNLDQMTNDEFLILLKKRLEPEKQPTPNYNQIRPVMEQPQQNPTAQPVTLNKDQEKQVIAEMMMKLHKKIIILCIMVFVIPVTTVLVSMMNNIIGICIAMFALVYPAFLYAQSFKAQDYLSRKYNLRSFMLFKNQQPQQPSQKTREETIF